MNWYEVSGENPEVDFNGFGNYLMTLLRSPNIETGKQKLKMITDECQDKDKFILNNKFCDEKWS